MQNKKNLSRLLTFLSAMIFFILPVRAQVTIGDKVAPHSFSIVEIETTYQKGGLRLPQLTAAKCDSLKNEFLKPAASQEYKDAAEGLVVYNVDAGCVEFWRGTDWESACDNSGSGDYTAYLLPDCDVPAQPGAITGSGEVNPNISYTYTYSVPEVPGASYSWALPVGWTGSSTGNSITATITGLAQSGTVSVTAKNDCGSSKASTLDVTVSNRVPLTVLHNNYEL